MRFSKLVLLVVGMSLAASAADNPFVGTWKLNVEKSTFRPGPPMKAETVTIAADGSVSVISTEANGQVLNWSYATVEGTEVPVVGMGANSALSQKPLAIQSNTPGNWRDGQRAEQGSSQKTGRR